MYDPLGYALVIEMRDLLAENKIFQQSRTAIAGFQGILIVADRHTQVGRQHLAA